MSERNLLRGLSSETTPEFSICFYLDLFPDFFFRISLWNSFRNSFRVISWNSFRLRIITGIPLRFLHIFISDFFLGISPGVFPWNYFQNSYRGYWWNSFGNYFSNISGKSLRIPGSSPEISSQITSRVLVQESFQKEFLLGISTGVFWSSFRDFFLKIYP